MMGELWEFCAAVNELRRVLLKQVALFFRMLERGAAAIADFIMWQTESDADETGEDGGMSKPTYQEIAEICFQSHSYLITPPAKMDETWFGRVVEFEGCMAEGETRDDLMNSLNDAKWDWIAAKLEMGERIPKPGEGVPE